MESGSAKEWVDKASEALNAKKYDEALSSAEMAIRLMPDDAEAYNARGGGVLQER